MRTVECSQLLGCTQTHKHHKKQHGKKPIKAARSLVQNYDCQSKPVSSFFVLMHHNPVFNCTITGF